MIKKFFKSKILVSRLIILLIMSFSVFAVDRFYWETPSPVINLESQFPKTASNKNSSLVFWQEVIKKEEKIYLSCARILEDGSFVLNQRFAGPYTYSGEVPDIYSVAMNSNGTIAVAVEEGESAVGVFTSSDSGKTFLKSSVPPGKSQIIAPRVYASRTGAFVIFSSVAKPSQNIGLHEFYLCSSVSQDGKSWTSFNPIQSLGSLKNPFYPVMTSDSKGDYLVCQAQYNDELSTTYQLYSSYSTDGGKNWQPPVLITGEKSFPSIEIFSEYDNQRPNVFSFNNSVYVSWERCSRNENTSSIWFQKIDSQGTVPSSSEEITEKANAKNSVLFDYDGDLYIAWYDNRTGANAVYFAKFDGSMWQEEKLSVSKNNSIFPIPLKNFNRLSFVWQENTASSSKIVTLQPDISVSKPKVSSFKYKPGTHSKNKKPVFKITYPKDSSGIDGFVYSWSQDSSVQPEKNLVDLIDSKKSSLACTADEDGLWYLKVNILDGAGNWSETEEFSYYLDLTPPKAPQLEDQKNPYSRFMDSNTFTVKWAAPKDEEELSGYTYSLVYLGAVSKDYTKSPGHPLRVSESELTEYSDSLINRYQKQFEKGSSVSDTVKTKISQVKFYNLKNGVYSLTVCAIDSVGYVGEPLVIPLLLNSYIPKTLITGIKTKESGFGELTFDISGQDFTYNGSISKVYIDKDGNAPFDLVITRSEGGFKVTDSKITGINIGTELDEGSYFVGVVHSERGLVMTRTPALKVETSGTVKVYKEYEFVPDWKAKTSQALYVLHIWMLLFVILLILAVLSAILFGVSLLKNINEIRTINTTVKLLEKGELMVQKTDKSSARKGSLKTSLLGFITSLIVITIILISILLGSTMLRTQERTLTASLQQRVDVLLQSIVTGATSSLPSEDLLELSQLHNQISSLSEAEYVTVTGIRNSVLKESNAKSQKENGENSLLYVWDSNDGEIKQKIDILNSRKTSFEPGVSVLSKQSEDEELIETKCLELDAFLKEKYETDLSSRRELLSKRAGADSARLSEINSSIQKIDLELKTGFEKDSLNSAGSVPEFNTDRLNRNVSDYLFYQPVIYRSNSDSKLVHGIVFLKVSTETLALSIRQARTRILIIVLSISVVLIALGIVIALLFASAMVKPIRRLEKAVKDIAEEHDKERLLGNKLEDLPNNEIGRLGDSVNRMQMDLGWNAQELNLQLNASEIQQALVPLEPLAGNVKQNIAKISDPKFEQFAYYKGAAGVSGDYFDCKKLDDRWYVLIKCDASGHAAPAGILVTIVATLYKKYFESWSYAKNGTRLEEFVYKVNDFLEGLNIKGKFVAMFICLYDSKTGEAYMCHAGDKLLRVYDSAQKVLNKIELPETPAVGPIPTFMVQMKGGYSVQKIKLNPKDILLLYTDGIEENGRIIRNADYSAVMKPKVNEKGEQLQDEYGNLLFEAEKEEFGENRVKDICEAVLHGKKYILTKDKNPSLGENLEFDFTKCKGTTQELILALTSLEKVFRFYKPKTVTEKDLVEVDVAIDGFLKEHFNLYEEYCNISQVKSKNPNYIYYQNLKEDVQEDDLTMLAVLRPE